MLTGDGGDEIFGGYLWYKLFEKYERYGINSNILFKLFLSINSLRKEGLTFKLMKRLQRFLLKDLQLYTKLMRGLIKEEKGHYRCMFEIPSDYDDYWHFRKYWKSEYPVRTRLQYLDLKTYLPDDILTKVDRVSMANSLEARVPLLSKEIVEFVFTVPEELRYHKNRLKGLLKYAYRERLPDAIINRGKKGFSIPLRYWGQGFYDDRLMIQEHLLATVFKSKVENKKKPFPISLTIN